MGRGKSKDTDETIDEILRTRGRSLEKDYSDSEGIESIWEEQSRLERKQNRLEAEYKKSRQQAKKLKSQLNDTYSDDITSDIKDAAKTALGKGVGLLSGLLKTLKLPYYFFKWKNSKKLVAVTVVAVSVAFLVSLSSDSSRTDVRGSSTNGSRTSQGSIDTTAGPAPVVTTTNPDFNLLLPNGKSLKDLEVAEINPPDSAKVYAYSDTVGDDVVIQVTQQRVPESFNGDIGKSLEDLAYGFQAKNIILVNNKTIYHGYSDKNGGVQSLIFIKQDRLVFIASPQELPDEVWASYYLSLDK